MSITERLRRLEERRDRPTPFKKAPVTREWFDLVKAELIAIVKAGRPGLSDDLADEELLAIALKGCSKPSDQEAANG